MSYSPPEGMLRAQNALDFVEVWDFTDEDELLRYSKAWASIGDRHHEHAGAVVYAARHIYGHGEDLEKVVAYLKATSRHDETLMSCAYAVAIALATVSKQVAFYKASATRILEEADEYLYSFDFKWQRVGEWWNNLFETYPSGTSDSVAVSKYRDQLDVLRGNYLNALEQAGRLMDEATKIFNKTDNVIKKQIAHLPAG